MRGVDPRQASLAHAAGHGVIADPVRVGEQLAVGGSADELYGCGSGCGYVGVFDALTHHRTICRKFHARLARLGLL